MSGVWYCRTCGYEVGSGGRCHNCGERLTESSLAELEPGESEDEVGYRLAGWDDQARGQLIEALNLAGLRHRFEQEELVVTASDEAAVDGIVEACGAIGEEPPGGEEEEATVAVEALYDAARRLRSDPTDMVADGDLAAASVHVFLLDRFYGVDAELWAAIGRVTRRLLAALGAEEALEDDIRDRAAILCRLLEPIVAPQAGDATPWEVSTGLFAQVTRYSPPPPLGEVVGDLDAGGALPPMSPWPRLSPPAPVEVGPAEAGPAEVGPAEVGPAEVGPAVPGDEADEVAYELVGWLPEQRAWLSVLLERAGIAHGFDGEDLVVNASFEARAEELFDRVEQEGGTLPSLGSAEELEPATDLGEEDEARYKAICELFASADRVAGDPANVGKCADLVHATLVVADWSVPFGMTEVQWWQIRARAKAASESIALHADQEVVRTDAANLRDLLRSYV